MRGVIKKMILYAKQFFLKPSKILINRGKGLCRCLNYKTTNNL